MLEAPKGAERAEAHKNNQLPSAQRKIWFPLFNLWVAYHNQNQNLDRAVPSAQGYSEPLPDEEVPLLCALLVQAFGPSGGALPNREAHELGQQLDETNRDFQAAPGRLPRAADKDAASQGDWSDDDGQRLRGPDNDGGFELHKRDAIPWEAGAHRRSGLQRRVAVVCSRDGVAIAAGGVAPEVGDVPPDLAHPGAGDQRERQGVASSRASGANQKAEEVVARHLREAFQFGHGGFSGRSAVRPLLDDDATALRIFVRVQ